MWAQVNFFRDGSTGTTTPILSFRITPLASLMWRAAPDEAIVEGSTETLGIQIHLNVMTRDRETGVMRSNGMPLNIKDAEQVEQNH
jgi:hypothetical protein